METIILCTVLLYLAYKYSTKNFNYWKKRNVPYIKPTPIFGNFLDALTFRKSIGDMLAEMYNEMPQDFFGIWVFSKPHIVVKSPELIKLILVKDFQYFNDRAIASDKNADAIGSSLLFMLRNPEWKIIRSKMTPAFTSGKIKSMIPLINEAGENMKTYLTKMAIRESCIEAKEVCAKYSTDVITSCAFGVEGKCFENEESPFRTIGKEIFDFKLSNGIRGLTYFFLQELVSLFKIKFVPNNVTNFLRDVFWTTLENRETKNFSRNDVIDLIIKLKNQGEFEGVKFEGDRVVAQAIQFFLAGFETTSSTMGFTLYELCLNKNVQNKLRAEIKNVLEKHGDVSYDAVQDMQYLHKVVQETLRKYPVLPFLDRKCNSDYKLPGTDVIIERDTPVYIPMFGLHYDPKYWVEPQKYDPERFNEDQVKNRPTHVYIPFGSGPHNCIGERFGLISTKIGLIHILTQFEVEKTEETPVPIQYEPKSFILASKVGLPMRFIDTKRRISVAA